MYDALVVGGGPAGLSAATWLARYRRRVLVVDGGEQRNRWVDRSYGYFAHDPAAPADLLAAARRSLERYRYATVREADVTGVRREAGTFVARVGDDEVEARRLVLATGVVDGFPEVEGFFEHYGASVFHCPTCDGLEAEGRRVVALGWSEHVAGFATDLLDWAREVVVVTDGHRFRGDDRQRAELARAGVRLVEEDAVRFVGRRGDLRGVVLRGGVEIACDLAFFSVAHRPRSVLAEQLGCALTDEGCVRVDEAGRTSVDGVFAAGDLTPGLQLVQVAAAKGAVAGVHAALSLR